MLGGSCLTKSASGTEGTSCKNSGGIIPAAAPKASSDPKVDRDKTRLCAWDPEPLCELDPSEGDIIEATCDLCLGKPGGGGDKE